jgi:hypothetical protein
MKKCSGWWEYKQPDRIILDNLDKLKVIRNTYSLHNCKEMQRNNELIIWHYGNDNINSKIRRVHANLNAFDIKSFFEKSNMPGISNNIPGIIPKLTN